MFKKFMSDVIGPSSFKKILTEQAMRDFSKQPDVLLVHSPVLFRIYALYAQTDETYEDRPTFFRKVGKYLYYERFNYAHGDEFYYYIKFNTESAFYQEHKDFIKLLILSSEPSMFNDYVGDRSLTQYNKSLKENE